jgi:hypothetical protein
MQRNMQGFQRVFTIIDAIGAKTSMTAPDDIENIMRAMKPPPGLPDMQQMIATAKGVAESRRAFANDILKNEKADDPDKASLHE